VEAKNICLRCNSDRIVHWIGGWKIFYTCLSCKAQWEEQFRTFKPPLEVKQRKKD